MPSKRYPGWPPLYYLAPLLSGLLTAGCPLSDDYYVETADDNDTASGGSGSTLSNGATNTSPTATSSSGGSGGSGGSSNTASSSATATADSSSSGGQGGSGGTATLATTTGDAGLCFRCLSGAGCDAGCTDGWAAMAEAPLAFEARERSAYVATDSGLFIWGGLDENGNLLRTGAIYDVASDTWTEVALDASTPTARHSATAVWTGEEVIVWGGLDGNVLRDGASYDPASDTWSSIGDGLTARGGAAGAYLPYIGQALFWGGETETGNLMQGVDFYEPMTDTWTIGDSTADPGKRKDATWAAGDRTFWLFGGLQDGSQRTSDTSYWSTINNTWMAVPAFPGTARRGAFGVALVSTSLNFHVWGGESATGLLDDGYSYAFASSQWLSSVALGTPSPRRAAPRESGWTFALDSTRLMILGGLDAADNYLRDGGIYTTAVGWAEVEAWPSDASHAFAASAYVAGEVVIWGGRDADTLTKQGLRYLP